MVEKMLGEAAHRFMGINPETGAILGAIAGNIIFSLGGKGNSLGSIGKVILDNLISGKYRRDIHPFVPPVPTPGATRFGLNFNQERGRCLQSKMLFEDPEFPACDRSLYFKTPPDHPVEWMRPGVGRGHLFNIDGNSGDSVEPPADRRKGVPLRRQTRRPRRLLAPGRRGQPHLA